MTEQIRPPFKMTICNNVCNNNNVKMTLNLIAWTLYIVKLTKTNLKHSAHVKRKYFYDSLLMKFT